MEKHLSSQKQRERRFRFPEEQTLEGGEKRTVDRKVRLELGLLASLTKDHIPAHIGPETTGGLEVPEDKAAEADLMEIWGSAVDPLTGRRGQVETIWAIVLYRKGQVIAEIERPDPELPTVRPSAPAE